MIVLVAGGLVLLLAGDDDSEPSTGGTTAPTAPGDDPGTSDPPSTGAGATTVSPGATTVPQDPTEPTASQGSELDTKAAFESVTRLSKGLKKPKDGNGCPLDHFDDVVEMVIEATGFSSLRSEARVPLTHTVGPDQGLPSISCTYMKLPIGKNGMPVFPKDPSNVASLEVTLTVGVPKAQREAMSDGSAGTEFRGSNRGADVYHVVGDQTIAGLAGMWIDDNLTILTQITGRDAQQIDQRDFDLAIAQPVETLVDDAIAAD